MRVSQDANSWRASGAMRRDFRAGRGEPEVERGKHKRRRSTPVECTTSPSKRHEVERFVVVERRSPVPSKEGEIPLELVTRQWNWRCQWCHGEELAPWLLAPVADLLEDRERGKLLAATWCTKGHLVTKEPLRRWWNYRTHRWQLTEQAGTCLMCGWREGQGWMGVKDLQLYRQAGVPEEVLAAMGPGRRQWRSHYERVETEGAQGA